jgi:hypothetical protein
LGSIRVVVVVVRFVKSESYWQWWQWMVGIGEYYKVGVLF